MAKNKKKAQAQSSDQQAKNDAEATQSSSATAPEEETKTLIDSSQPRKGLGKKQGSRHDLQQDDAEEDAARYRPEFSYKKGGEE